MSQELCVTLSNDIQVYLSKAEKGYDLAFVDKCSSFTMIDLPKDQMIAFIKFLNFALGDLE